jgi:hypothetical protein
MRRIVLSLAVAVSAALTACSGGGQVLGTGNNDPERVVISLPSQLNVARVLAGGSMVLSATDVKDGNLNGVIYNNTFTWHAAIVNGASYPTTNFGQSGTLKPCAAVTLPGSTTAYAPDYTRFLTVDPANSANVTFNPPATIPASPVGAPTIANPPGTPATPLNAYCAVVTATAVNGKVGSIVVAIVSPASPQQ